MEKFLIYYGADIEIEFPKIKKEKIRPAFSWGFYATLSKENAENNSNIVNVYEVKNIDKLNIKIFGNYNDEYFEFTANCKQGKIHLYDGIITPITDNKVGEVSFHTIRALDSINFLESYKVYKAIK